MGPRERITVCSLFISRQYSVGQPDWASAGRMYVWYQTTALTQHWMNVETRDKEPRLVQCWATVFHIGPTLNQLMFNVSFCWKQSGSRVMSSLAWNCDYILGQKLGSGFQVVIGHTQFDSIWGCGLKVACNPIARLSLGIPDVFLQSYLFIMSL